MSPIFLVIKNLKNIGITRLLWTLKKWVKIILKYFKKTLQILSHWFIIKLCDG